MGGEQHLETCVNVEDRPLHLHVFLPQTPEVSSHDADGNLTNDGHWAYTWDGENRLTRLVAHSGLADGARQTLLFSNDWQGRRISKVVSNWTGSAWSKLSENKFLYDGWNLIAISDASNTLLYSFRWGTDLSGSLRGAGGVGGLVSMTVHHVTYAGTYFYAFDGNGNVVALINAADGSIAARYEYGPFGELIRATGPLAFLNPFRFSTKFQDDETGFLYYGYRYYDPSTGRWINRDPLSESGFKILSSVESTEESYDLALYVFVENQPTVKIDELGLHTFKGCLKRQEDDIKAALRNLCNKAKNCGDKCPSGGFPIGVREVCDGNLTFNCVHRDFEMGGLSCKTHCGMARGNEIFICPSTAPCGGLSCVIFHEAGHTGGLPDNPHPRPDFDTFARCMGCPVTW